MRARLFVAALLLVGCDSNDAEEPPRETAIYAHSPTTLFRFDPNKNELISIGAFESVNGGSIGNVTDIALDKTGVMYAATFGALYRVEYKSGSPKCSQLAALSAQFNGLTVVPAGMLDSDREVLVGVESDGSVHRIDVDSTGARVARRRVRHAHVLRRHRRRRRCRVRDDQDRRRQRRSRCSHRSEDRHGHEGCRDDGRRFAGSGMFGVAYWNGVLFGFASSGSIYKIDPKTALATEIPLANKPPGGFWGAGSTTTGR